MIHMSMLLSDKNHKEMTLIKTLISSDQTNTTLLHMISIFSPIIALNHNPSMYSKEVPSHKISHQEATNKQETYKIKTSLHKNSYKINNSPICYQIKVSSIKVKTILKVQILNHSL